MVRCPRCGLENPDNLYVCAYCGQQIWIPPQYVRLSHVEEEKEVSKILLVVIIVVVLLIAIPLIIAGIMYFLILGIDGDDNGANLAVVAMDKSFTSTQWVLTVIAISGTSTLSTQEVYVTVHESDQSIVLWPTQLSTLISGKSYNGVIFLEAYDSGHLNAGDSFQLNRTYFAEGSKFMLINQSGDHTYIHLTI